MTYIVVPKVLQRMEHVMRIGDRIKFHQISSKGFSFIGLMILVAISGIALGGTGIVWHQDMQRGRERELLIIGEEYRKAIGSYYENSPGQVKEYPEKLEDLLLDHRFPFIKRHIRKLYRDPFFPLDSWGLQLQEGKIIGVYSKSELEPIKKVGFMPQYSVFSAARKYNDWKFIYIPGT